jgi:TadE-like protein
MSNANARPNRKSKRGRPESGATMVEFAMIALPFFMIIFGIIDFSILIFDMHSANAGSRASARFIGTGELDKPTDCTMDFNDNFSAPPPGLTPDELAKFSADRAKQVDNLKKIICMTKNRSHLDPNRTRILIRFEDTNSPLKVAPLPIKAGNSVVVCMMTRITSLTRLYSSILDNRAMHSTTRARLEGGQGFEYSTLIAGGELPLPGETWSDCYRALTKLPAGWTETADPATP